MAESTITQAIMRYLKSVPNCYYWKQHGGYYTTAGLPDIICCLNGHFVAFEVKTPTGKLTKLQSATLKKINDANGQAFKVTSVDEVKAIIRKIEEAEYG